MTHAESQDLLVDLAFGELDPARAAEVESHLAGCEECRKEKAALEEARRMAAPLRELEEPSAGFDDRILEAARTQAQLDHDGNVGPVVEVSGNVRPLGVEAARIDAHGPVKVRPIERKRPRWMLRAALGGSVAMAAALALVVSTTLETRRSAERASRAQSDDYRIQVKPAAPEAADSALRDATVHELAGQGPGAAPQQPAEMKKQEVAQPRPTVHRPAASPPAGGGVRGVVGGNVASGRADAPAVEDKDKVSAESPAAHAPVPKEIATAPLQAGSAPAEEAAGSRMRSDSAPRPAAKRSAPAAGADARPAIPASPAAEPAAVKATAKNEAAAAPQEAKAIEAGAQEARHAGDYVKAAALYRSAADARRRAGDPGAAAWNLAHAVECLAAVGQFEEARRVREELARVYPAETTALSAARRALREVDAPGALPASRQQ